MGTKLQIMSDLHVEFGRSAHPRLAPGADVVVVAGDVMQGTAQGFAYLRRCLGSEVPIVAIAGNHEFYGSRVETQFAAARRAAPLHGIAFLEDEVATVAGLRFAGATLWTDYEIYGDPEAAQRAASVFLNDHSMIRGFRPADARARHDASRTFLRAADCDVVVTHHLPSHRSVHPNYAGDPLTPAFASDLEDLILARAPALWVRGHTHRSSDYRIGATRVVCNPHGYGGENPAYDPALVIELDA